MDINSLKKILDETFDLNKLRDPDCKCSEDPVNCVCPKQYVPPVPNFEKFLVVCDNFMTFMDVEMKVLSEVNKTLLESTLECRDIAVATEAYITQKTSELCERYDEALKELRNMKSDENIVQSDTANAETRLEEDVEADQGAMPHLVLQKDSEVQQGTVQQECQSHDVVTSTVENQNPFKSHNEIFNTNEVHNDEIGKNISMCKLVKGFGKFIREHLNKVQAYGRTRTLNPYVIRSHGLVPIMDKAINCNMAKILKKVSNQENVNHNAVVQDDVQDLTEHITLDAEESDVPDLVRNIAEDVKTDEENTIELEIHNVDDILDQYKKHFAPDEE